MKPNPFLPLVPAERLNENFRVLMESQAWFPTREIIRKLFRSFSDPDGNFLEQFQTTGFDARVWELYLWAYFLEADFAIDRSQAVPDFQLGKSGARVYVEAVTANPTQGLANSPEVISSSHLENDLQRLLESNDQVAIKLGSPLFSNNAMTT